MEGLAKIVETVADYFGISSMILFGVGLGANVLLRFAVIYKRTRIEIF